MNQSLERSPSLRIQQFVVGLGLLVALPHVLHMPLPITLYFIALVIWRFLIIPLPSLKPNRWLLLLLTLLGLVLVYQQHQTLLGYQAGVSLLVVMLTLKLMELHRQRDIYVATFIGYFVVITQFLFNQSFLLTLYLLLLIVCQTALLMEINRSTPSKQIIDPLKQTLIIALQALPIAALLFVLFPRLSHPLWQFGHHLNTGITGISDRVTPGSISHLIQSSAVAFRVEFKAIIPPPEKRYWRGLVLWETDGFEWFNQNDRPITKQPLMLLQHGGSIEYDVFLQAHNQRWLFSLDLPAYAPADTLLSQDYQLSAKQPVYKTLHYPMQSYTDYLTDKPDPASLKRALILPANVTQRESMLVKQWRQQTKSDAEVVQLALTHFNKQPYVYTLSPPKYLKNPVDQFLFEGREGFCEHFASSFTLLMRLAGIPARMVVGYQGGEINPLGDYLIVRQSDAHAWSEVWLPSMGWQRVDPTAAVAPERIRHPIQTGLGEIGSPVLFKLPNSGLLASSLKQFGLLLDAANIGWQHWILGYSRHRQVNLLQHFGLSLDRIGEWTTLMIGVIGLILTFIALRLRRQGRQKVPPVLQSYLRFCHKLARIGLPRRPNEGPLDYSQRIARERPDLSTVTRRIISLYLRLRYGRTASIQAAREFHLQVRRFHPKKL